MQTSIPSPYKEGRPWHWRFLSLALMVLLYPKTYAAWVRPDSFDPKSEPKRQGGKSRPYLPYINPTPLRFDLAQPPPDLLTRPAAAGPPKIDHVEAIAPAADVVAPAPAPVAAAPTPVPAQAVPDHPAPGPKVAPPHDEPPPIIPDDTPTRTRHEDFLPYFRFPGADDKAPVIMPPDNGNFRPPPSSATYQQR